MDREALLTEIWNNQDTAFDLTTEYNDMPHKYGVRVLYQAEAYIISSIGQNPGITTTELAKIFHKTISACSQITKRLIEKDLIYRVNNAENKREYYLFLTPDGENVFQAQLDMNRHSKEQMYKKLEQFSDQQLEMALLVQKTINEAYKDDLQYFK